MNRVLQAQFMSHRVPNWSSPNRNLRLSKDSVHVWGASLNQTRSNLRLLEGTLHDDERARAAALYGKHRWHFVASRGILRAILGHYLQVRPSELRFSYTEKGKPHLAEEFGPNEIRFNLSHSHDFALYAITKAREVGVDLEKIVRIIQLEKIVSRFLPNQEKRTILQFSGYDQFVAFFQAWTRKEALLKAQGRGLSHLSADTQDLILDSPWCIKGIIPAPWFVGAVATEGTIKRLDFWKWQT